MKAFLITLLMLAVGTITLAESKTTDTADINDQQIIEGYFFTAARTGNVEVMEAFLDAGIPVDHRNVQSYTPLMIAAYNGQQDMVEYLLTRGANACLQDKRGNTALMGAIFKVELSIAKRLLQTECDHEVTNKQGESAESYASTFKRQDILSALRGYDHYVTLEY